MVCKVSRAVVKFKNTLIRWIQAHHCTAALTQPLDLLATIDTLQADVFETNGAG